MADDRRNPDAYISEKHGDLDVVVVLFPSRTVMHENTGFPPRHVDPVKRPVRPSPEKQGDADRLVSPEPEYSSDE